MPTSDAYGATTPADRDVRTPRLPSLTGLRFFAAALVVVVHVGHLFSPAVAEITDHGKVGVSFFFLLSGFILTWSASPGDTVGRFYRRRAARILPLHWVTWAFALLVVMPVRDVTEAPQDSAASFLLLQAWTPGTTYATNGVAWSLSCELFFYALFPLLLPVFQRMTARRRLQFAAAAALAVVAAGLVVPSLFAVYIFPPVRLGEFVLGIVLALAMRDGWRPAWSLRGAVLLATIATAVTFAPGAPAAPTAVAVTLLPFLALIASAARADIETTDGVYGVLGRPLLVRLGEWSFALYMTHTLVIRLFVDVVDTQAARAALLPALVAACVLVSGACFTWIERPLERRLRGPQGGPPGVSRPATARVSSAG
jgi:peptidoglycan/LPS O-acetylase OafA/YrhL